MLDLAAILTLLKEHGGWAVAVAWLLWDRYNLTGAVKSAQEAHRATLETTLTKVTEAVTTSGEVIRANTLAHDRNTAVISSLNETVKAMQQAVAGMEKDLDRIERGASA